jgi:hypothetical protein
MTKVDVSLWFENGTWVTLTLVLVIPVLIYFALK